MKRQFSPLLRLREDACLAIIQAENAPPLVRNKYRRELEMYMRYRGSRIGTATKMEKE